MSGRSEQKAFVERCYNERATEAGGEAFMERGYRRERMRSELCFCAVIFGVLCSFALADPVARFGGGGYDGYDRNSARPAIGCPQVSNAGGATNVLATSAC